MGARPGTCPRQWSRAARDQREEDAAARPGNQLHREFTVVETDTFDPRSIQPQLSLFVIDDHSGSTVCCPVIPGFEVCGSAERCFRTERTKRVQMSVTPFRLTEPIEQWVYRSTYRVGDQVTTLTEMPLQQPFWYGDMADEYCYSLDAIHVVTGEVVRLGADCMKYTGPALYSHPPSDEDLDGYLRSCASPPAGYEGRWQTLMSGAAAAPDAGSAAAAPAVASTTTSVQEADDDQSGCRLPAAPRVRRCTARSCC